MARLCMMLTLLAMTSLSSADDKGISIGTRIINAFSGASLYRFTVRLNGSGRTKDDFCTGSLLTRSHILTTANCVFGLRAVDVTAGAIEMEASNNKPKNSWAVSTIQSSNWTIHPNWTSGHFQHDLAIITLPRPFRQTKQITTIELDDSETPLNYTERLRVTGWGLISTNGDLPNVLRWGWVDLLDEGECHGLLEDNEETPGKDYLCKDPTINANSYLLCLYDAGGPLFSDRLVGVTTYFNYMPGSVKTCTKAIAVFTYLRPYIPWIRQIINTPNPPTPPTPRR